MRLLLLVSSVLLLVGCGVLADDDPLEGRVLAPGYTPCQTSTSGNNYKICQPNQYCVPVGNGMCMTGCLSNDNCSYDQECVKRSGRDKGTCRNFEESVDLAPGYTTCGSEDVICQPGQFCIDSYYGFCRLGCLSELNCTENQDCIKDPDSHIGYCVSASNPPQPAPDLPEDEMDDEEESNVEEVFEDDEEEVFEDDEEEVFEDDEEEVFEDDEI